MDATPGRNVTVIPAAAPEHREGQVGLDGSPPFNTLTVIPSGTSTMKCPMRLLLPGVYFPVILSEVEG